MEEEQYRAAKGQMIALMQAGHSWPATRSVARYSHGIWWIIQSVLVKTLPEKSFSIDSDCIPREDRTVPSPVNNKQAEFPGSFP